MLTAGSATNCTLDNAVVPVDIGRYQVAYSGRYLMRPPDRTIGRRPDDRPNDGRRPVVDPGQLTVTNVRFINRFRDVAARQLVRWPTEVNNAK